MSVAMPLSSQPARSWDKLVRTFDAELAQPEIEGIPIGSTLTDLLVIEFINGSGQWGMAQRWFDRLRWLRRYYLPPRQSAKASQLKPGRILVTWRTSTARIDELMLPLLEALSPDRCMVLYQNPNVVPKLPSGVDAVSWVQAVARGRSRWRGAFRRCWPQWRSRIKALCASFGLPRGARERLALSVLVNSQSAVACLDFLERYRPAAIVTDYDRAALTSPLVLAARSLEVLTFSLQHGVLDKDAGGYIPVIADRMFCWGDLHRRIMTAAGQDPAKLMIGGCPRLTRELSAEPREVRSRLRIAPSHRLVMLGTSPVPPTQRRLLATWFCDAVSQLDGVSGLVRLHPSESVVFYDEIARTHPQVQFLDNSQFSLDESLAAADVVVVQISGLGSDALVKRRPAVVVEIPDAPLGHGKELIEQAGCPRAASVAELAAALRCLLFDEEARRRCVDAAERFVQDFCACFGRESAARIAETVNETIASRRPLATVGTPRSSRAPSSSA
jgi:hypothetical protein